jgi:L-threonylcarbamoyladenylate synthase
MNMQKLKINSQSIREAVELIKSGGVVIFPTETVYGIGALATDEKAIRKLFGIKNRSLDKPLQILISDRSQADLFAAEVSNKAKELMKKYWPGPLTLVFKKKPGISNMITAGGDTVGLRIPGDKNILELIKMSGPLAASSANTSGEPDPKSVEEIKIEADLLLDGGKCKMGQPSTVIDVSVDPPLILREGSIHPF